MRSKFTLSSTVFESCAKKLVGYLFETVPVTTRFHPEPVVFLIEVNFRKGSKIGTVLSKKRKFGIVETFVVSSMNFIPLFSQLHFEYLVVSTLRSLENLFFKNFRGLSNNVLFFAVSPFLVVFEVNSNKQNAIISSKLLT